MDIATIIALILGEQQREKKAAESGKNDQHDAFINAIMPEIAGYFLRLFQESGGESLLRSVNGLVLALYRRSPDALQFFFRLILNMKLEKLQGRWPPWVMTPIIVFLRGYFGALEDATKNKPRGTSEEIKRAAEEVAAQAQDVKSKLGKKFRTAQRAVRDFTNKQQEGPDMGKSKTPKPPPPPGGGGGGAPPPQNGAPPPAQPPQGGGAATATKTRQVTQWLEAAKDIFAAASAVMAWWGDRGEDHAQEGARALFWVMVGLIVTAFMTAVAALSVKDAPMAVVGVLAPLVWIFCPFCLYWFWRERNARLDKKAKVSKKNPHERPGNGLLELGGLALVAGFVGGVGMLILAAVYATAAYAHFARAYVWAGLLSIGGVFLASVAGDAVSNGAKDLAKILLPKELESPDLELRNRVSRSFGLLGVIYGLVMLVPVGKYVLYFTDYSTSTAIAGLYTGLVAGFATTRLTNESGMAPPDNLRDQVQDFARRDHRTARRLLLFGATLPILFLLGLDFFLPPTCPADPGLTASECPVPLPTYAERWRDSDVKKIFSHLGDEAAEELLPPAEADEAEAGAVTDETACSPRVVKFVGGIQEGDCEIILREGRDPAVRAWCAAAVECGALAPDGRKVVRVREVVVKEDNTIWGGWYFLGGIGGTLLLIIVLAIIGGKEEKAGGGGNR